MIVAGIDEAGRGCVIGPLIMCGISIKETELEILEKIGVKDSKKLSPTRREDLYKKILDVVENHVIIKITPQEIDSRTTDNQNLNILEIDAMASIINRLKPNKVFIDAIQSNIGGFVMNLNHRLSHQCEIIAENRADDKFPVVSAASIVAKVTRDRIINELKTRYGDFGSGYPSDPKTKEWLKTFYKKTGSFPPIVRKSWFTVKQILKSNAQQSLDRYL